MKSNFLTNTLLIAGFLLLLGCQTTPSHLGSTTTVVQNDSGIGGTGQKLTAQNTDPTGGFGGTGHSSSGFGGTGVIGTITEFGSIWVNDIEIEYPDTVSITSPLGTSEAQRSLKLGQQVILETKPTNQETITTHIELYYPVAGQVRQITKNQIQVENTWITLTDDTQYDDISLIEEQYIAVNAFQASNGQWIATRINDNPNRVSLQQPLPKLTFSSDVKRFVVQTELKSVFKALKRSEPVQYQGYSELEHDQIKAEKNARLKAQQIRQQRQALIQQQQIKNSSKQVHDLQRLLKQQNQGSLRQLKQGK
ncbi:DUF5666 domain-containing protein [Hydrogenovibrio sp. 3SP14C1]|uniref:DUF5666 domain-containing protein n=1 Tax=Hydrogenovibrio sp. 3SP14C1 TaxID=3038774 RepID=UPI0024176A97|nr:DUF5666 domain-containing protein [Hydrogenovibrio sp. 3SP14C1]MDG4812362.1 DUF5666 domain-containing protein [Hydrogenovibrio sp. 3SP14C1]